MYDKQHFTHDAAVVSFKEDVDGITVDDDGIEIDWDDVETVRIDNPPHADAFDTKRFYRLPATVAKPIKQPYHYGEDNLVWLKKPREELKKAAWSLDNAPVTLDHPDTTMVKDVDDVHGFWNDTHYVDSLDDLDSYAHVPVGDEEAKEHIESNGDVSVGFYNQIARTDDYDGIVGGGDDEDDIDGYQTNLLLDHTAFVDTGRCSSKHGCGLDHAPSHGRGHVETDGGFKYGTDITNISETEESQEVDNMEETTDQPEGVYVEDGDWYGIKPSENPDGDSPKYPLQSCNDVKDAWNLRGSGDYDIEQSTLEARIKRVGDAKDCPAEYTPWTDSVDTDVDLDSIDYKITPCTDCEDETDNSHDTTTMTEFKFEIDDLSPEAAIDRLAEEHEGVEEVVDELEELRAFQETVDSVTEELDMELEEFVDEYEELTEKADAYDEIKAEEMEDDAERLAELTDKYGDAEEVLGAFDSHEDIEERIDLLEDAVETSETTIDSGNEENTDSVEEEISTRRAVPDAWE